MKYQIFDETSKEYKSKDDFIVTQDGLIACWDEWGGWNILDYQDKYKIIKEEIYE